MIAAGWQETMFSILVGGSDCDHLWPAQPGHLPPHYRSYDPLHIPVCTSDQSNIVPGRSPAFMRVNLSHCFISKFNVRGWQGLQLVISVISLSAPLSLLLRSNISDKLQPHIEIQANSMMLDTRGTVRSGEILLIDFLFVHLRQPSGIILY